MRLVWDFDCLRFDQYISISPHGIDCKQTWCKKIYCMDRISWLKPLNMVNIPFIKHLCAACVKLGNHMTWTSEWVITLLRSCELFLHRDISRVCRTTEIFLPKQWTWFPQMITMNLFLFLCRTTIDCILILKVYGYSFKTFTGETAIS